MHLWYVSKTLFTVVWSLNNKKRLQQFTMVFYSNFKRAQHIFPIFNSLFFSVVYTTISIVETTTQILIAYLKLKIKRNVNEHNQYVFNVYVCNKITNNLFSFWLHLNKYKSRLISNQLVFINIRRKTAIAISSYE